MARLAPPSPPADGWWSPDGRARLVEHLQRTGLAGRVATTPRQTLQKCAMLVAGEPDTTFGLSDWHGATLLEAVEAVRRVCGGDPGGAVDPDGPGEIDPGAAVEGLRRHRDALARAAEGGARVLVATGHPTGLLTHYQAVARALQRAGCLLLCPLDDRLLGPGDDGRRWGVRHLDGVACAFDGASLRHTHMPWLMEAMLDALGGGPGAVDLVVADHGFAGAAIERGLPTASVADVNDPALPLAAVRGRTSDVLPIDDNLAPSAMIPLTEAVLDRVGAGR